jgi:hypothetical protein
MDAEGFNSPNFKYPYEGLNPHEVKARVTRFKGVEWCDPAQSVEYYHGCDLINHLKWVTKPPKKASGLSLEVFQEN